MIADMVPHTKSIGTVDHDLHRSRRTPLNPFFSKASVAKILPWVKRIIDQLCDRLEQARISGEPINLKYCYSAMTTDVASEYCFSRSWNKLCIPDFDQAGYDNLETYLDLSLLVRSRARLPLVRRKLMVEEYVLPLGHRRIPLLASKYNHTMFTVCFDNLACRNGFKSKFRRR